MSGGPRKRARSRFGALGLLALIFGISSLFRSGDLLSGSLAWAQTISAGATAEGTPSQSPAPQNCILQPVELAAAFSEREARADARALALDERSAALALAEAALRGKLEELSQAEARLRRTITMADGAAEADVTRLTAVYESMKPKDAAMLFEAMDPGFAAGFLGRMRPETAAPVLAGMAAEKAYAVSVILAGRNAGAGGASPAELMTARLP